MKIKLLSIIGTRPQFIKSAAIARASKKLNLYRKNSLDVKSWSKLNKKIDKRINKLSKNFKNISV